MPERRYYIDMLDLIIASDPPEIRTEQNDERWELDVFELPEELVQEYTTARAAYMRTRDALIAKMEPQQKNQKARKKWRELKNPPKMIVSREGFIL